jgi:hypothetical protein
MTPEVQSMVATFRRKAAEGTLTPEEMKQAIIMLREGRAQAAQATAAAKRKTAVKVIPTAEDLLKELGL